VGYRRYYRRPRYARYEEPGLIDDLAVLIRAAMVGLFRAAKWLFTRWRKGPPSAVAAKRWGPGHLKQTMTDLPYRQAKGLLSQGERAFWMPLQQAVNGKYRLFAKVRLADVVCCPPGRRDESRWFLKIGRYHVDFVVCAPDTTAPLLVIELDDRTHRGQAALQRDDFKDAVLRAAGIPVYRIPAQQAYDPIELRQTIQRLIDAGPGAASR
jgi:hypothetical protein